MENGLIAIFLGIIVFIILLVVVVVGVVYFLLQAIFESMRNKE